LDDSGKAVRGWKWDAPGPSGAEVTVQTKLIILGLLIVATTLEVSGDAIVRIGLGERVTATKGAYFLAGAVLLFGYGLALNLAPIEFHRVVGVYIATLFIVWQIISFLVFRSVPTLPILAGGSLIVLGGIIVAFWTPAGKSAGL
jgi:small multidrug resistance family-3 protein